MVALIPFLYMGVMMLLITAVVVFKMVGYKWVHLLPDRDKIRDIS
jgi:hypothetical protein